MNYHILEFPMIYWTFRGDTYHQLRKLYGRIFVQYIHTRWGQHNLYHLCYNYVHSSKIQHNISLVIFTLDTAYGVAEILCKSIPRIRNA